MAKKTRVQLDKNDPRVLLGKAVRAKRHLMEFSQEDLAEKAGLHWTYIGGIERGERNVSLLNIVCLAGALGCTASELLAGIKSKKSSTNVSKV